MRDSLSFEASVRGTGIRLKQDFENKFQVNGQRSLENNTTIMNWELIFFSSENETIFIALKNTIIKIKKKDTSTYKCIYCSVKK